mgnify:CR=1 FL=1
MSFLWLNTGLDACIYIKINCNFIYLIYERNFDDNFKECYYLNNQNITAKYYEQNLFFI